MAKIKKIFEEKIKGYLHLLVIVLLIIEVLYGIIIGINFTSGITLFRIFFNSGILLIFAVLIFWFGLIPTIVAGLYLSLDFILYFLGLYDNITLFKLLVTLAVWMSLYDFWKDWKYKKQLKRSKK